MEEDHGIWRQISDIIPSSEHQEIVNSIGTLRGDLVSV